MVNPVTVNTGIIVPLTGADVDTWGSADVNPNMVAIDGLIAGVQTVTVTNVPVTLTSPAGFVPTPSGGPTQAQNKVLRFTGVMTADVRITLPTPGYYVIENLTTGSAAFVLSFQGLTATEVVGTEQGSCNNIYNDGANVRFVGLGRVGQLEFWGGVTAMPAWVAACTKKPYLYADGTATHTFSDYPYLAAKYVGSFGGNGVTTFGVPDMRGRVPLAYDGTGTRITTAGCGINGQTLGAVNGANSQYSTLVANQIPSITSSAVNSISVTSQLSGIPYNMDNGAFFGYNGASTGYYAPGKLGSGGTVPFAAPTSIGNNTITVAYSNASQQNVPNVQPSQVAGIWVVKT